MHGVGRSHHAGVARLVPSLCRALAQWSQRPSTLKLKPARNLMALDVYVKSARPFLVWEKNARATCLDPFTLTDHMS